MNPTINYRQTIALAIGDEMRDDPRVILIGEDIGEAGGAFKTTDGLFQEFGPERVRDTPISEQAIVGAAIGAAITGLRPVADLMFADFAGVCFDQIANQAAKYRYMTDGQVTVPLTIQMCNGAGAGFAAQHSQSTENWFLNVPGLKIVVPSTPEDLYGLLRSSIQEDNPVIVFEHKNLFSLRARSEIDRTKTIPLGKADVVMDGQDVTVVATQQMRHRAVEAAEQLREESISVAVIDPRTLVPFDDEAVFDSIATTGRLVVAQETPADGSWGASLVTRAVRSCFNELDAPPSLIASDATPVPYAKNLEEAWMPSVERISEEIRACVKF